MASIVDIKRIFAEADIRDYKEIIEKYASDERDGVKKIVRSAEKKLDTYHAELERSYKMFQFEHLSR